jgi:hypothetical protein
MIGQYFIVIRPSLCPSSVISLFHQMNVHRRPSSVIMSFHPNEAFVLVLDCPSSVTMK